MYACWMHVLAAEMLYQEVNVNINTFQWRKEGPRKGILTVFSHCSGNSNQQVARKAREGKGTQA